VLAANTKAIWFLTRGTGLVSVVLLTASVVLGITQSVRWATDSWPRFIIAALHKNVSLLVTVFLGVHIATAVIDGFAPIGWLDAVIPFRSGYRPIWLGLGALAFDLLIALIITSLLRVRLGYRAWRVVHWAAYACWPLALVHGLGTGTDTAARWALAVTAGCFIAVGAALTWRLANARPEPSGPRTGAVVAAVVVALAVVVWTAAGPLQRGWARRAGTPLALLASTSAAASASVSASASASAPSPTSNSPAGGAGSPVPSPSQAAPPSTVGASFRQPFSASITGTIRQAAADANGSTTITILGTLSGGASGTLQVVLHGTAAAGGGVTVDSSEMTIGPPAQPRQYQGPILRLRGSALGATVRDNLGEALTVDLQMAIDRSAETFTGSVSGQPASGGQGG